ncbi:MAG: dihydrofolate reductase [Prevotellaceae bacterium]|jgi:dihydrofolate reductase|nr:dihydrofolate reductase [Prevotellaceae bacterium]
MSSHKKTNKISIVAALANNNAIGYKNGLLCHLPADLRHFKELTSGHTVIMGRKTFCSLPNGALPNRRNIVVSKSETLQTPPLHNPATNPTAGNLLFVKKTIAEALEFAKNDEEIFIIGGESIYRQTIELTDILYITKIYADFEADTFFPKIDMNIWQQTEKTDFLPDEKNHYKYSFIKYERFKQ